MFSELCRETLRKAAVCYSSGRSASPSPSPPNSPPSSPAKEPKTVSSSINHTSQNYTSSRHHSSDNKDKKYATIVTAPTSSSSYSSFKEKRHATPTVFSGRRSPGGIDHRDLRRSPERGGRHEVLSARGYSQSLETSPEPMDESSTSEDEAGAAPEEGNQRSSSSSHNRHSITKDVKRRSLYDEDSLDGDHPYDLQGRESVGSAKDTDRVKLVRDRQNEERQRKLEELRQQALAAQRFREQREEERRKRIDELRSRDNDRRNQVEERKRLIWEAERERREAILRKNQEREARIEAKKKNERSHIVFAFGSSTPRMLEPADTGGSTFWGTRRATSTTNVMMFTAAQPLTRRSSERELDGSKKRATSAGGLDRKPGEGEDLDGTPGTPSSSYLRVNRRRTDLMPTIPSPREVSMGSGNMSSSLTTGGRSSSSSSAKAFTRSPGIRSGEVTPSSPSRPHSSLSQQSGSSSVGSSNVSLRPRTTTTPRRPRPASIAGTGVTVTERHNFIGDLKITKDSKPPLPKVHHSTPKKPKDTTQDRKNITNDNVVAKKPVLDKLIKSSSSSSSNKASPRITPRATPIQSPASEINPEFIQNHAAAAEDNNDNDVVESNENRDVYKNDKGINDKLDEKIDRGTEKNDAQQESRPAEPSLVISQEITSNKLIESESELKSKQELPPVVAQDSPSSKVQDNAQSNTTKELQSAQITQPIAEQVVQPALIKNEKKESAEKKNEKKLSEPEPKQENEGEEAVDMSASMIAKIRITTEEEAKAALAERRRIAREQAEREAELERQRIEEEERLEMERQRAEEEEQRRLEEETLRLASEARQAEEQRLRLAIEEAQRREEEDRKRREEEAKQKLEKEEAERKAREEAEKQRIEMAERLKKEEEERIARRKRVEAIMLRTRGKNQPNTPTKGEGGDGDKLKEESPGDENKALAVSDKVGDVMTSSLIAEATEQFISSEQQALNIEHSNSNPSQPATIITTTPPTLAPPSNVVLRNGTTHSNGVNGDSNKILLIDNDDAQGNKDDVGGGGGELKSHNNHPPSLATTNATTTTTTTTAATTTNTTSGNLRGNNGINNSLITEPLIVLDNATVKQNNVTNNLLDLSTSDFEMSSLGDQILDINTPKLANEDSINSNLNPTLIDTTTTTATTTFNPLANSFVQNSTITANVNENNTTTSNPFNMQDNHQVTDLLS